MSEPRHSLPYHPSGHVPAPLESATRSPPLGLVASENSSCGAPVRDGGSCIDWLASSRGYRHRDQAGLEGSHGLSESASFWFADAHHGIMNIGIAVGSGPGVYPALIVATSDGGKTWKDIEGAPAGEMVFITQNDGWLEGQDGLLVTHDGAKTWKEVALPKPEKAEHDAVYLKGSLPLFPDKDHGFMVAEY